MTKVVRCTFISALTVVSILLTTNAHAADVPQSFTLDGRLYSDTAGTVPLTDSSITFRLQILDEDKLCILYEEQQTYSTLASNGYFSIQVGTVTGSTNRTATDSGHTMATVFQNIGNVAGKLVSNGGACAALAAGGKRRYVRIAIAPSTLGGAERLLSPDLTIDSVPNAVVAERAESLQGYRSAEFLKVNTAAGSVLSQTNLENLFTNTTRFNALSTMVDGTSTSYMRSNSAAGAQLPVMAGAPTAPTTGSVWYDSSDSKIKFQTAGGPVTVGTNGGGSAFSALTPAAAVNTIDNSNFAQAWNWSTALTETPLALSANALTTGTLLDITSSSGALNSTNGLFRVANTSAATTGVVARIQANSTVGSGLTVLANGNVGAGTSTPTNAMDVLSTGSMIGGGSFNSAAGFRVGPNNAAGTAQSLFIGTDTGRDIAYIMSWRNFSSRPLILNPNEGLGIGRVGIGATVPTAQLDININDAATPGLNVKAAAAQTANLQEWQNSAGTAMSVVTSTGNVGLGTASPQYKSHAYSAADTTNILSVVGVQGASGSQAAAVGLQTVGTGTITSASNKGWLIKAFGDAYFDGRVNDLSFMYYNGTAGITPLHLDSATGNVGIGTTAPATALDLNGAWSVRGMAAPAASVATQGRIYFDSTANKFKVSENNGAYVDLVSSGGGISGLTTGYLTKATSATAIGDSVISESSGNIGIGSATPTSRLVVVGQAGDTTATSVFSSVGNYPALSVSGTGSGGAISATAGNTATIKGANTGGWDGVQGSSFNGAGTTGSSTNFYGIAGYSTNSISGFFRTANTTGSTQPTLVTKLNTGQTGDLFQAQDAAGTGLFNISYQGKVGIGTTAPVYNVDSRSNAINVVSSFGYGTGNYGNFVTASARGTLASPTASQSGDSLGLFGSAGYGATTFPVGTRAYMETRATEGWTDAAQGTKINFGTTANGTNAPNDRMTIDQNGNVGIGTTTPAAKLDVTGNIRSSGQLATGSQTITGGTTAIDWNNGNVIATDYGCASPITFANLADGGTYTLVVTSANTTRCDFSTTTTGTGAGTVTYRFNPANADRDGSNYTVYTLLRVGSLVLVSWSSGF